MEFQVVILFVILTIIVADLSELALLGDKNRIFVETGCYIGEGIRKAIKNGYDKIISVELSQLYHKICQNRFSRYPQISIINGDSALELQNILDHVKQPVSFWLDGHFSAGDTAIGEKNSPLREELLAIKAHPIKTHTIMIDDIRLTANVTSVPLDNQFDDLSLYDIITIIMSINPRYSISFVDGHAPNDILVARIPDESCNCHQRDANTIEPSPQRHVTATLHGDMGEQMFIIAATVSYAWRNNLTFNFEPSHLRDAIFNGLLFERRDTLGAEPLEDSVLLMAVIEKKEFSTLPAHPQRDVRLMGRFQNYLYFDADYLRISDYFQWALGSGLHDHFKSHYKSILHYTGYRKIAFIECVYQRREDGSLHAQLPVSYYQRAVQHIDNVHGKDDVVYVIFFNADVIREQPEELFGFLEEERQIRVSSDMHDALRFMLMSSFDGGAVLSEDSALGWWGAYVMDHARTLPIVVPRGSYAAAGAEGSTEKRMLPHWIEM